MFNAIVSYRVLQTVFIFVFLLELLPYAASNPLSIERKIFQPVPDLSEDILQRMEHKSQQRLQRRKCWKNVGLTIAAIASGIDLQRRNEAQQELTNIDCISIEKIEQNVNFMQGKIASRRR